MSEWKNNLNQDEQKTESYCTGWGIIDGLIFCAYKIKNLFTKKKIDETKQI